jgi:serine/threonine-protein kinase PknG
MNLPTCPNCHQTLRPGDDICENCGAVLAPAPAPGRSNATPSALAAAQAISLANTLACPNCRRAIHSGDDICEHCGAVLDRVAGSAPPAASAPAAACPNCHAPR